MKRIIFVLSLALGLCQWNTFVAAQEHEHGEHAGDVVETVEEGTVTPGLVEVGNKICPVSKENVFEMGEPFKYEYNGKIYNLCCKMCVKDFQADPEKYSKIAEESVQEQEN